MSQKHHVRETLRAVSWVWALALGGLHWGCVPSAVLIPDDAQDGGGDTGSSGGGDATTEAASGSGSGSGSSGSWR